MSSSRLARVFWIGAAAILVVAALVALVAVLRGDFSDTDGRILGTLAAALFAGSAAVAGLALVERGGRVLGWAVVTVSAPAFAAVLYPIWDFAFEEGDGSSWQWGWLGVLTLGAALIAATARLLARTDALERLAWVAGGLAVTAAGTTAAAIWNDDPGEGLARLIAVLWILAGLCYLLVPVLQRFTSAGHASTETRVLAELDGVELVATRSRVGTVEAALEPGEQLLLRRRS